VSLITDDWRLKLLAVGLAILMLGAVAFSQNPPTSGSLTVGLGYAYAQDIVLLNPPTKITVTYTGLADVINKVNIGNLTASVDATHASPGTAVKLNVTARTTIVGDVHVQNPSPIVVNIDRLQAKDLPVSVITRAAPGWSVTKAIPTPALVHFQGPASWETNLVANVTFPGSVSVTGPIDSPNQPVQLQNSSGSLDLTLNRTVPPAFLDVNSVSIRIEASPGSTSSTVPLVDAPYINSPAAGYHVVGITISPGTVIITGDAAALGKIQRINLPAIDLAGRSSNYSAQVQIPYPANVNGTAATATIVYQIAANPAVSPPP
jgi:YbbR domain-containing protein